MTLSLYNTLTRKKETFKPHDPNNVRMYVCGPTVYDFAHIGNARPVVVFDVLYRLLRLEYGADHVTYVRNITDVEDKIIDAARANDEAIGDLTARTERAYHDDMGALGALPPDHEPRATQHIAGMLALIQQLLDRGHAYAADGHVLFHVPSMPGYGALSGRSRDDMIAGARVEVAPYKKDPADFVLWKPSTPEQPGWDSPWGRGRPGWHIECSAMSEATIGPLPFDIHGGGIDLAFPHHENEIAQSVCAHGLADPAAFATTWVHNGHLIVEGEKMSKSLGNFITVRELLEEGVPGEVIRLTLLSTHYRQPLDFTRKGLDQARARLDRLYRAREALGDVGDTADGAADAIVTALDDDLNTPLAISQLEQAAGRVLAADETQRAVAGPVFLGGTALLGLVQQDPEAWFRGAAEAAGGPSAGEIEQAIVRRAAARKAKDFAEADRIRDALHAQGILLEDGPGGTTWRKAG